MMTSDKTDRLPARSEEAGASRPGPAVRTRGLEVRFGRVAALDGVDLDLGANRIHGLLGRNGAGKTTLLSVLASLRARTAGDVTLDGADPFEDAALTSQVCLVRERGDLVDDERISWNLDFLQMARPGFDRPWANALVRRFGLDPRRKPQALSRGQRSALGAVVGLASRAPLTMFDEVQLGMDAPTRDLFYRLLLADFAEHPRTIILSSHLIAEIEHLLETVVILHHGTVLLSAEADLVRRQGLTLTGPRDRVDALARDLPVIATEDLGGTRRITAFGPVAEDALTGAGTAGVEVGPAPLQDLLIHLTQEAS